jgi:hypothetical protein
MYVTEHIKKYILLLISIQDALRKRKFRLTVNSAHVQRIPATRLISQHSESDFVKVSARLSACRNDSCHPRGLRLLRYGAKTTVCDT